MALSEKLLAGSSYNGGVLYTMYTVPANTNTLVERVAATMQDSGTSGTLTVLHRQANGITHTVVAGLALTYGTEPKGVTGIRMSAGDQLRVIVTTTSGFAYVTAYGIERTTT